MKIQQYGADYLAIFLFVFAVVFILFEAQDPGNERSFITSDNFHSYFWIGALLVVLGVLIHISIGQYHRSPVDAQSNETVLELLMLQRVSYRTSTCVALGYGLMFSAVVLKVMNIYFSFKSDEKDI